VRERDYLLAAARREPLGSLSWLALADRLEEKGEPSACWWRSAAVPVGEFCFWPSGGDGHKDGHKDGHGDGHGYGYGYGGGREFGDGYGFGFGDGYGDGDEYRRGGGQTMPVVGKNQLIVLPHGWVICGFVAEQIGPFQFRVENASVICRTGGTPWDCLAEGEGRAGATLRPWGTVTIGPNFVLSREWKGKLP